MTAKGFAMNAAAMEAAGNAGMQALRAGDFATAIAKFQSIVEAGAADTAVWLALSMAYQAAGDRQAEVSAVTHILDQDPDNIRANLIKADALVALGHRRAAMGFYAHLEVLVPDTQGLPPQIAAELKRARETHAKLKQGLSDYLQAEVEKAGFHPARSSRRFRDSLDILTGRKQRYVPTPRAYFFPELPAIEFYDRARFAWLDQVEAATEDMVSELMPILEEGTHFGPYIEVEAEKSAHFVGSGTKEAVSSVEDWTAAYLIRDGKRQSPLAERCPKTLAALDGVPLEAIEGRAPFVLFSKLTPGAWIAPHTGFLNSRLVCHLPLLVPDGCWFRVGNQVRLWERGKAWVFDDTIEHEARNQGTGTRVVLIFNIWHPDLTEEERHLVAALLAAVESFEPVT
ncbi:aspartyl/asparaginyl beta-hydroxylase domain-containing protein [Aquidulcibacter sp.]|uniref:aspartyl/asparaginyl beta-hydroxylase domain-containing protein n=1 Tax=Aquidulcibacter sp. TaxID=2052990 RepID=UPI0025B9C725|nr:aspartyl/asparaginyl beta-hydroxylase domain-containing protein [Aquidulcibacter sp.]MCA3693741.1 aspartyl/asparaginyl beta-hydroxylase domain-containing protein [Aquidulcibacter sp.]